MKVSDIAIHDGDIALPYKSIQELTVVIKKERAHTPDPTIADANCRLQEEASKIGANAVINVTYTRKRPFMRFDILTAVGTAVIAESDEKECPFCAETIKRAAKKCKHCGSDLLA